MICDQCKHSVYTHNFRILFSQIFTSELSVCLFNQDNLTDESGSSGKPSSCDNIESSVKRLKRNDVDKMKLIMSIMTTVSLRIVDSLYELRTLL